jgi:putative DNA primase/helicase
MDQDQGVHQRVAKIEALGELTAQPRWVVWRLEPNPKKPKPDKMPYTPGTIRMAKANDPATWRSFAEAVAALDSGSWAGIGFELGGSGITGIDLDHCIDPATGEMHPAALKIVSTLDTYAEISQSGTGIHLLAKGKLPPGGRKTGKAIPWGGELELYDTGRFFALTGDHLPDTPLAVEDRQQEVAELHAQFFSPKPAPAGPQPPARTLTRDDDKIVELARKARNSSTFAALYDQGDTSGHKSHSEADLALCGTLAFYCGPSQEVQVDRLFRASKLMRDKWDEKHGETTYGGATIAKAYEGRTEFYGDGHRAAAALADPLGTPEALDDAIPAVDEYLTDLGNARRLVRLFARDMRFVSEWGWMVWDGKRWTLDVTGMVQRWAKKTALNLYDDAADALARAEKATREEQRCAAAGDKAGADRAGAEAAKHQETAAELTKWARTSQMRQRLEAMVALAQSELPVVARPDSFDRDPWLFNCDNGTVDLRTGELRDHQRSDLITKISPVAYDPKAECATWTNFLTTTTQGDKEHEAYLQRAVGYTLTGDTREEVFFIVLGPPASGKTTLVEAASAMMGDYAHSASFDTFLQRKDVGAARGDIADLMGARLVAACEAEPTRHLAEVMINHLTGGDRVTARHIYQREFTFTPSCKVWLAANESPKISDTNSAVWRRLRRLPFEHEIPEGERDPNVKATLKDPQRGGPAVLRWAVEGCLQWQKIGLATPKVIRDKSADLRSAMDPMGDFFAECCVFTPYAEVPAGVLRAEYETWCRSRGEREQVGSKEWGERLRAKGAHSHKLKREGRNVSLWLGIGLKEAEDTATTATTATEESVTFEQTKNENLLREVTENAVAPVAPVAADAPAEAVTTDQGPAAPAGVSVDPARVTIRDAVTYHELLSAGVEQATAANLILDFDRWVGGHTMAYPEGWIDAQQVYDAYTAWIAHENTHPDGSAKRISALPQAERDLFDRLMQRAGFAIDGKGYKGLYLT